MKIYIWIATLFIALLSLSVQAQKSDRNDDKFRTHKVAFITTRLELTVEESEKFWPIFNEMETKMHQLRKERKQNFHHDWESLSDAELIKKMQNHFDLEQKELDLKIEYHEKFLAVLGPKKLAKLYKAEHEFRRELLHQLRSEKEGAERKPPHHR